MTEKDSGGRERPWTVRTHSGHSSASASNSLIRSNIAKGQTGLSVALVRAWRASRDEGAERVALEALGHGLASGPAHDATPGAVQARVRELGDQLGRNVKILIGTLGLDGHSSGAEQVALRARDAGFEVVYQGIGVTAAQLAQSAVEEGVHLVGLSVRSGSPGELVPEVLEALQAAGLGKIPVVVGGVIPESDARSLEARGVARVYTPEGFSTVTSMDDLVELVRRGHGLG